MRNQIIAFAFLLSLAVLAGCREDTIIKANVTPSTDFISTDNKIGDTLTIYSKTIYDDSIRLDTINTAFGDVISGLGTLYDPFFGTTNWGIYMQVVPPSSNTSVPNDNVDSAVLILPYAGFSWGDTTHSANAKGDFSVYLVTDDMHKDVVYYSKQAFAVDNNPIGSVSNVDLWHLKYDSVYVHGANRAPHLRIKLSPQFTNTLYNAGKSSSNLSDFLSSIKGLYVRSTDTNKDQKVISYFYLTGTADYQRAAIALYHNGSNSDSGTLFYSFTLNDCVHSNFISRSFGSGVQQFLNSNALSDSIIFVQNEPGAALDIRIPYIKNLPQGIINKAQLVITQVRNTTDPTNTDLFFAPTRLYPVGVDPTTGGLYNVLDRLPVNSAGPLSFIDGVSHNITLPDGKIAAQYYINIPREVQKAIVNKANELHLRINGTATYPGAYRLIAGGSHSTYKIRLNIVYSKIN